MRNGSTSTAWRAPPATAQVNTKSGTRNIRLVAIRASNNAIYRFLFISKPEMTSQFAAGFRQTTYSFRELSASEAAELRPQHIEVIQVQGGDTVDSLANRMAVRRLSRRTLPGAERPETQRPAAAGPAGEDHHRVTKPRAPRNWRPPIAAVFVFGFGGLVAGAIGAVLLVALDIAERNTNELMRQTAELSIDGVVANLAQHLQPPRSQVEFLAKQLSDGIVPLDDDVRLQDLLLGSLAAAPQITGVAYVRADLRAVRAGREGRTSGELRCELARAAGSPPGVARRTVPAGIHLG